MKNLSRKIFYAGLFRFQLFLLIASIIPLIAIKLFFTFSPSNIESFVNLLILFCLAMVIIGGCVYILAHYASLDKTLGPVSRMAETGEMASRVAHDLRGPLSGIQAVLHHLHTINSKDKTLIDHLNLLELSSKRLQNIAEDLLKKRKGEEEERTSFDLHQVLDELIGEYSAQSVLAGIRFEKHYASQAIFLMAKRNKIERMFGNVTKNAIEAMDFEGGITISTEIKEEKIFVAIKDTGSGMSKEKIEKILSGGFTEGKRDGNGIGLMFVKEVLADHGGALKIDSEVGKGSLFEMELPLAKEASASFEISVSPGESVLVIDDDPSALAQWDLLLGEQGVESRIYLCFEDFEKARSLLSPLKTAVVDYHFDNSELNGIEIIKKLKEQGFEHLYLCTAEYWKPSLRKQAEELGVGICPKPLPKIVLNSKFQVPGDNEHRTSNMEHRTEKGYKVLVIDDDKVIRMAWKLMKKKLHIEELHAFANWEAVEEKKIDLNSIDIAFVDKNVEGSKFGCAEMIHILKSKQVGKIVLASGENEEELRQDPQFAQADFVINDKIPSSFKEFFS